MGIVAPYFACVVCWRRQQNIPYKDVAQGAHCDRVPAVNGGTDDTLPFLNVVHGPKPPCSRYSLCAKSIFALQSSRSRNFKSDR
jgi:hypothetical protein